MPVSKKRKKDGKPVQRSHPVLPGGEAAHPDEKPAHGADFRVGKPRNPFVTQQQAKRGSQRGR
ncbi:MAG TPA: hypothetical protein VIV57_15510 [Anaeromyxobacter sp.]